MVNLNFTFYMHHQLLHPNFSSDQDTVLLKHLRNFRQMNGEDSIITVFVFVSFCIYLIFSKIPNSLILFLSTRQVSDFRLWFPSSSSWSSTCRTQLGTGTSLVKRKCESMLRLQNTMNKTKVFRMALQWLCT